MALATSTLRTSLESKRSGYDCEGSWHKLLIDAYRGSGGFQGRHAQADAGFWGSAAEAYSQFSSYSVQGLLSSGDKEESETYLDRYPREDLDKFQRRIQVAYYLNYVKPTTNLKISYIVRKPHKRNNVPDRLAKWIERTQWDEGFRLRALMTAVVGWCVAVVNKPKPNPEAITQLQEGKADPYVVMMLPSQVYNYSLDLSNKFQWAKFCLKYTRQETWDAEPQCVKLYAIYSQTEYARYEQVGNDEPVPKDSGKHGFKTVPVVPWRTDTSVEDVVRADSINAEIVPVARRLFNACNELDENLRGSVFPLLIVPRAITGEGEGGGGPKEVGVENGLTVDPEQKNLPVYIAPPASIAETYEKRIEKLIIEIYRMARVEYDRSSGVRSSAQSQQQNFQQTNVSIVDFATALAAADKATLMLVGSALGCSDEELAKMECIAHESYEESDLNEEIGQVIEAVTQLPVGTTAKGELTKRLLFRMLSGLNRETAAAIESEVDEALAQAEKDAEMVRKAAAEAPAQDGADPNADPSADPQNQAAE